MRLPLATLDCSTALLARALDEAARAAGASALVSQSCVQTAMQIKCQASAVVPQQLPARVRDRTPMQHANAAPLSTAIEFATFVDFLPTSVIRHPAASELPTEVPDRPAADLPLGQMRLLIEVPATRAEAIEAVRIAAHRLFARHFVSPNCVAVRATGGWECRVLLFSPEWDERVVASAQ